MYDSKEILHTISRNHVLTKTEGEKSCKVIETTKVM